jgi:hypothetical protein
MEQKVGRGSSVFRDINSGWLMVFYKYLAVDSLKG